MNKTQQHHRILDPIHGLIRFNTSERADNLAWKIINTPVFQRLRRIKQLGFAEFVFAGATHSRFSHSIGVFHLARALAGKVKDHKRADFDSTMETKLVAAQIAALLHDIGHGPFSHAFEKTEERLGNKKSHEKWTLDIIQHDETLRALLSGEGVLDEVVQMIDSQSDNIYHAIISSAFDADRLDYLQRDRYMCGIGSGGFDSDWMLDCLEIAANEERFILNKKSSDNAVEYLLARYHLHINVYTHKTVRAAEMMLSDLLFQLSENFEASGCAADHPLREFFTERSVPHYLALDDITLWGAVSEMSRKAESPSLRQLAGDLLNRRFYKSFDVGQKAEEEKSGGGLEKLEAFKAKLAKHAPSCVIDEATITAYDANDAKKNTHQGIVIGDRDIAELSPIIRAVPKKKIFRVYAREERDLERAKELWGTHSLT